MTLVTADGCSGCLAYLDASPSVSGRARLWRIGTPLVVLACGGLFVVSANNSEGTDLRPGRYTDLASLVDDEADKRARAARAGRRR